MSDGKEKSSKGLVTILTLSTLGFLGATIGLAVTRGPKESDHDHVVAEVMMSNVPDNVPFDVMSIFEDNGENNVCMDKNPNFENVDCVHLEGPGPQSGANVTKGYQGLFETVSQPLTSPYWQNSMCPVNVHWHLGTEHYSVGEYDENGTGPNGNTDLRRNLAAGEKQVRAGFRCHHYDASDSRFTTEYDWKHCIGMEVGETYEVHWPHSAAGACGTVNQYQTPFYDGVFCTDGVITPTEVALPGQVGVQGQIYTVINDESYFYPDMIRSWIVDGEYGQDIAYYTGSTTGTSRSNEICSQYTPITWQVDRECHLISASSFDKLCYDMKQQRDNMADDLHAHGSRELVNRTMVANNMQRRLGEHEHEHSHAHDHIHAHGHSHSHVHDHDHDHAHAEWF